MQIKISKTLESIIAEVVFTTSKAPIRRALKDQLALAILRHEGSLAHQILSTRLHRWQIRQIALLLEQQIASAPEDSISPELFFRNFCNELRSKHTTAEAADIAPQQIHAEKPTADHLTDRPRMISTIHALAAIAEDKDSCTAREMQRYHLTSEVLLSDALRLAGKSISRPLQPRDLNIPLGD